MAMDRDEPSDAAGEERTGTQDTEEGRRPKAESRMVVYAAEYRLGVESVKESLERVKDMVKRFEGFIESVNTSDSYRAARIVARVPVARFNQALDEVESLGRVDHKTVSASDVTMRFNDVALRIDTAKRVRDRLQELLRRVEKASEKVEILREIARLTAEIDNMTSEMNYLRSRATFSTITMSLAAVVRDVSRRYMASPFGWIAGLNPFNRSIVHGRDGDLSYDKPGGFFDFDKDYFSSRSTVRNLLANPDGSVGMRLGVVDNYPPADQRFWEEAVKLDFENRMYSIKKADTLSGKGLDFNRYTIGLSGGSYYMVAFAVKGEKIIVFESHFQDEKALKSAAGAVDAFIKSVGYE